MILDDIVRANVHIIFPGYEIRDSYSIKLSRDAELYIDDEFSGNLINKIKDSLEKRNVGPASRFVYDREITPKMLSFLTEMLDLSKEDLLSEGRYHNNFDFFKFPDFGMSNLKNQPLPPLPLHGLENAKNVLNKIRERDYMVHPPYHSYESVIRFFEDAAADPNVTHIKIVQYRVASKSRIMNALMKAVQSGKHVSAFVEVKARFDEEANLKWGERLEKAGVRVHYSFPGLKVHAKIALIRRLEPQGPKFYAYLGTGNFHEDTAKIYSDIGIFTVHQEMVAEIGRVFNFLETVQIPDTGFDHLLVGQFNIRSDLESLLYFEMEEAKAGRKAECTIKLNSLEDDRMIDLLYEASSAGVTIHLIIRGICCLIAGKKGLSENIEVISIVDRYLEHARIFHFHHAGANKVYLSSADWMKRNLSRRIEVVFPIYDETIKNQIIDLLKIQWADTQKSRSLLHNKYNTYRRTDDPIAVRSQLETYYYFKRLADQEQVPEVLNF